MSKLGHRGEEEDMKREFPLNLQHFKPGCFQQGFAVRLVEHVVMHDSVTKIADQE